MAVRYGVDASAPNIPQIPPDFRSRALAQEASPALSPPTEGGRWVGMRRACEILGVNQSTLRHWTDKGRVPVFLTPGGHRRYREADLRALTEPTSATVARTPLASVLLASHERYESVARRLVQSSPWSRQFDEPARRQFRLLGGALLRLLSTYVISDSRQERERSLRRGRALAAEYGEAAAGAGLSGAEATEAFVVFRKPILELVHDWLAEQRRPVPEAGEMLTRVNHFMDQILVSLVTAHERWAAGPAGGASR